MFFWWKLSFHWSIAKLCQKKFSAKASVIENHGLGTITIKQKERDTA